jgi:hypothetical protein
LLLLSDNFIRFILPPLFGHFELNPPPAFDFSTILGIRFFISTLLQSFLYDSLGYCLLHTCFLFFLVLLLRNQKVAFAVYILFPTLSAGLQDVWSFPIGLIMYALFVVVLMRFGLIAVVSGIFFLYMFWRFPITLDSHAWYSDTGFTALAIFAAIVIYAFRTSLGGRPMFGTPRLDD